MGPKLSESREIACKVALQKGSKAAEYEKTREKNRRPFRYMGSVGRAKGPTNTKRTLGMSPYREKAPHCL